MKHQIRIERKPNEFLPRDQFAWKLGAFAVNATLNQVPQAARDMICNRIIDVAGVALHAVNHDAVVAARWLQNEVAGCGRSRMFGAPAHFLYPASAAAFVNAVAGRDDDWHDCYLKAEYSHPADTISALIAKAQEVGASGVDLMLAIAIAYEVQCSFRAALRSRFAVQIQRAAGIRRNLYWPAPGLLHAWRPSWQHVATQGVPPGLHDPNRLAGDCAGGDGHQWTEPHF